MDEQFLRTRMILGADAVERLRCSHVIVFGLGGVGSYAAEALARAGVGELTLVDQDTLSVSNINRQLYALHSTVGMYKADVAAARCLDINPALRVHPVCATYDAAHREDFFTARYDYIVDAIDLVSCKLDLVEQARERGITIITDGYPVEHRCLLGSPLHKLGNRMHSEKTDELFAALSRAVRDLSGDAQEIAAAYFYGFVCHYALDSQIHPYVYCRQVQFCTENPKLSASAVHSRIESDIDYLLYERACHRPITEFDPEERYQLSPVEQAVLSVVLHVVLKTVYGADVSTHELRRSFTEMTSWESFLYSESRAVYRGAKKAEALLGRGALLTGHMKLERPMWDALNLAHQPWHNLWKPDEIRTDSVPELFGLARIRAAALAGQYAAQFDAGWLMHYHFDEPFDSGNPKNDNGK